MKGLNNVIATALLLAITIAGALMIYSYTSSYLSNAASGEVVVESAELYKYSNGAAELYITLFNVGARESRVTRVELLSDGAVIGAYNVSAVVPAGSRVKLNPIALSGQVAAGELYVRVVYDGAYSKPARVSSP